MEAAAASLTAGLSAGLGPSASMPPTENESLMNSNETEAFVDLLDAAVEGNLGRVKSLLKIMDAGAASRLDFRRSQPTFGESPLHRAASVEVAKALVDHGVNVDLQGAVGQTPLHTLVSAPHVVRYLLKCGARVNAQTVDHSTPLHWAVVQDCAETVQILLRAGAKIDHQNDSGNAALHMVCSLDVARLLVSSGARLDLVNGDGQIPLEAAASKPDDDLHLQVASYLLDVSHSASLRASSSFNIFRPEFDIYGSMDPILQRQESIDMGSNNPASDVAAPVASSSLKQHQLERQLQERREREVELGIDTRTDVESGMPPPLLGHIDPLPPILERQDTKERINSTLKRVDARERWRLVRQRVLKGDLRENRPNSGAGGLGEMMRGPKRLRFASEVAQHARSASMASSWSDDGVTNLVQARTDEFYFRFFEVMVRDRPKLALRMLDRQRTFLYARGNDKIYSYDTLLTGGPVTSNEILDKMVQDERHELISHEVVQWIFNIRWILFTREALLFEFAVHCIFVAFFFATTLYGEEDLWHCFVQAQAFLTLGAGERRGVHATQAALELVVFALNVRHLVRFFIELGLRRGRGVNVYSDPFTDVLPHVCVLLEQLLRLTVSTHIDVALFRDASNLVSAVGAVLLWIRLLSFAEGFEVIGITMCTIRRMLADIAIYLVVLLIYVTGFSHAITLIFRGSGSQLYGTMYNSWITLYFFVFNLDVGALNDEEKVFRKYSGYFFVGIYMVVVALVILNLIIAIMTNTFDEIQQNAKEQWLLQRARIILTYDLREKSLNKMYKMLCLRYRRCCGRTSDDYDVGDYLPELTRKNIVIEKGNGQVDVQVPAEWLHAVNLIRRKAPTYNSIRYTLFRRWKKLRRSPSFLWPELKETQSFFQEVEADEQRIAQQALNNEALHRRSTSISKSEENSDTEGLDDGEDSVESEDLAAFNGVYSGNAVQREESAGLLHGQSSQQRGWGTFESEPRHKRLAPKAASVSASSYVSAESSVANNMKRRASSETSAMRTGVEEELVRIGYFQRNPKRIAADRVMQSAIHLQRAAPPPPYAAADLSSVSSRQDLQEDEHEFEASPPAPGSAVGGVSGLGGPGEHAFADGNSVGESTRYSSSAAAGVRRRAKSFKRHTSTLEGQIQQEVDDMNDAMALHGVVPGQASVMDDTMNLRNEAAIEHLTGLVVRLSEQVSALEGRIAAQQKADSSHSVSGSEH